MNSFLASVAAFQGFDEPALDFLEQNSELRHCLASGVLFRQGDRGDSLYVVVTGTLQVEVTLPDGRQQSLVRLGPGDCVGEMALVFKKNRSATVHVCSDSELLEIRQSALHQLFAAHPTAHKRFLHFTSRRLLSLHLASLPMFAGVDIATLQQFDHEANWLRLAGGEMLFAQGDPPDYLYIVMHGRLEVIVERENGVSEVVDQIGPGACVGEMALLAGEPRSATVRAIRDSELVRLSKEEFNHLLSHHPRAAIEVARTLVGRLRRTTARTTPKSQVSTIALLPSHPSGFPPGFTEKFVQSLVAVGGSTLHLDRRRASQELGDAPMAMLADGRLPTRILNWLNEQEDRFRYVVYESDPTPSKWTDLCVRQADRIFLVASAGSGPHLGEIESRIMTGELGNCFTRMELILVHRDGSELPVGTMEWLAARRVAGHHHIRLDCIEDYRRLARFATGKAVGVVFGGGGARGYLQLGAIQALRESGIPIDLVGGASVGSMVAAQCALGNDIEKIIELGMTGYGKDIGINLLRDATLPIMAFLSARRTVKILKEVFGHTFIEDLWLRYFCVSSNLSTAEVVVHEEGPLWLGIRASVSVPGILPPVIVNGKMLVDGGLLNNLPVDIMRRRAGTVVAIDIALPVDLTVAPQTRVAFSGWPLLWNLINPFTKKKSLPHMFSILGRTTTLSSIHNTEACKKQADLYLHPVADGVDTLDWAAGRKLIKVGYRHALAEIARWKETGEARAA
jgi:CRP-like cAMP-binding protein/predicted acylesterase/phospholipase RssA